MNAIEHRWVRPGRGGPLLDESRLVIVPLDSGHAEVWEGIWSASRWVMTGTIAAAAAEVAKREVTLARDGYYRISNGSEGDQGQ